MVFTFPFYLIIRFSGRGESGKTPDLIQRVEFRDLKPVNCKDIIQLGMCGDALSDFLEHDSGRPAFFVNQQVAKHIQPFCPGEMAQAHGINYPDLADRSRLLGHGSTSAPVPAGRSDSVICPCRSSTALAAVSAPFLHAAMTASA
jgi:hypothetical protein